MKDTIVSIRIPESAIPHLKDVCKQSHFLDVSELVRSVVRKKWFEETKPELYELKKITKDLRQTLKRQVAQKAELQVARELEKIRDSLKDGDLK